jgi:malonate decarboxylase delta subunit
MEKLEYRMESRPAVAGRSPVLVGVTGSGNCEVLIEGGGEPGHCRLAVHTSARGFAHIWQAVLADFCAEYAVGGLAIEIHDVGATPAVVSLRLAQALEAWEAGYA